MTVMLLEWVCTSAFLILVTLVLRAALGKRIGGAMRYALWAAVLLRLLVPVQLFTSPLAGTWVAAGQRVERDVVEWSAAPTAPAGEALGLPVVDKTPGTVPSAPKAPALPHPPEPPAAPDLSKLAPWLGWAWLAGAGLAALVLLLSNLRFYGQLRRVRTRLEGADCPLAVYAAPGLPSPCLFGLLRPAVYITPEAAGKKNPDMLRHVLAHEYTHYKHGDHIWSLLRCAALAVHWWDPLVWVAAVLSRRDGELACDEGALRRLGDGQRAAYGNTLLALVTAKPGPADLFRCATTMAGDKKSLKERISRIAAAPKRVVWAIVAAVLVTALACVCAFGQVEPEAHTLEPSDGVPDGSHAMGGNGVVQPSPGPLASNPPAYSAGDLDFQFYAAHSDMTLRFSQLTRAVTTSIEVRFEPEEYTILDLDRDGADELIVKLMGQGGYLILHPTEDGLWGYTQVVRGMMDLKADGTFTGSSGAGDWGFSTVSAFGPDRMEEVCFTWCESTRDGGQRCFVNGSPAVLREFEAAVDLQDQKESAPWRPWTGGDPEVIRWLEEAGVDYDLSGPGGEAGLTADLDRNGIPETIQVTEIDGGMGKRLEVWENGKLLFAEEGFSAHAGYNALFLCNDGEGEYLLRYHPTMYQGYGTYNYQLFTLENGVETVAMEDEVEFDVNFHPMMHQSFDPEAIAAFMDDVNGLLSHSVQLLNTDQDLLDTFQWNGLLYDDLWWLDTWEPVFARDEGKTLRENLRDFQAAMEAEWNDPWGLILTAGAPSPTGVILNFHQAGGEPTGTLQYGSYYWLEREEEGGGWVKVPVILDLSKNWYWTQESYLIPMNAQTSEEVDWSWLYGELPPGRYRIGKEVMDFRGASDYDILNYYAEFSVDRT